MNISKLLYMAQHWKNKSYVLNSVKSVTTSVLTSVCINFALHKTL